MLKTLLDNQRKYLNDFFYNVDIKKMEEIGEELFRTPGMIIVSGVGKSGHIAQKSAATLISTGTRAFFLDPTNALHGDIGFIKEGDLFLCFSKSGASFELINLIPHIRAKGAKVISVVGDEESKLAKISDLFISIEMKDEICPFNLAPTTSSAIQLIFGDLLAIYLMKKRGVSVQEFARNHPGGLLGRKITHKVQDLMISGNDLPLCLSTDLLIDCLHELSVKRCGCLLVVDEKRHLKGIFTDGDLRRAIEKKGGDALNEPLSSLMTSKAKFVSPKTLALQAMQQMEDDPSRLITVMPVLEDSKVIGLIRMHDILQKELAK